MEDTVLGPGMSCSINGRSNSIIVLYAIVIAGVFANILLLAPCLSSALPEQA